MKRSGFSLIELLVGISIISLLSVVGINIFVGSQAKARDSIRRSDITNMATALEIYAQQNNLTFIDGTPNVEGNCASADTTSFYTQIAPYMSNNIVPKDPQTNQNYCYVSVNNGQGFRLFAKLETCDDQTNPLCSQTDYNFSVVSDNLTLANASSIASPTPTPTSIPAPNPTPTPTPTPNPFPSSGLTAYWKMEESGDVVLDHTGGDNGTAAATGTGPGKIGNGRVFNGTNSRITIGNTSGVNHTGSMSISAWINPDNADSTYRHVAIKWGEGTRQYFFARDTANKMTVWLSPNGSTNNLGTRQSSSTIPANAWTHVVMTYTPGSSINIYINGTLNNGTASGTVPSSLYNGGAPMYLGPYPDQTWKGMMDEVGIWNRALTAGEIATLYNAGAGRQP